MNPVLPDEALELRAAATKAFDALGGVELARRAEADPSVRGREVAPALAGLGIDDLDPRAGDVELAASAALCEAAGRVALPYPVAAALVRDRAGRPTVAGTNRDLSPVAARGTGATPPDRARIDHGDLFDAWAVGRLDGTGDVASSPDAAAGPATRLGTRLGPFVTDLALDAQTASAPDAPPVADLLLQLTLSAWTVLGTLDRAVELAVDHVNGRIQFDKPLAAFQAVRFQLADAAVAVAGLRELAGFTLWRLAAERADRPPGAGPGARASGSGTGARADVLALRLHALDTARSVLRTAQQLHGAAGVCDEYDVSVLTRMVQPALRLPFGAERTAAELAAVIATDGFAGLFPHGAEALA